MPTTQVQEVIRRLEAEDPLGCGAAPAGVRWRARRLEGRRYSSIFVLEPAAGSDTVRARIGSRQLVLKVYRAAQAARRQKEFDDLSRVHAALGGAQPAGVVRPVACYADLGALVTVRARGSPLVVLMRAACRRGGEPAALGQAAALCAAAGAWLHGFQAAGSEACRGQRPRDLGSPAGFLQYLDERLRLLCVARPGIELELRSQLMARAAAVLHSLSPGSLDAVTWSHSDFGPHNILVDGERLTVLDFDLAPQHPAFDATYFVESLSHVRGPLVDAASVRRLERAFLAGYGDAPGEMLLALFRLRHLVCSYLSESRRDGLARLAGWPGLVGMRARLRAFLLAGASRAA